MQQWKSFIYWHVKLIWELAWEYMQINGYNRIPIKSDLFTCFLLLLLLFLLFLVFFALDLPGQREFNMDKNRAPHCTGQGDEKGG